MELSARILPRRRGNPAGGRRHHVRDGVLERGARGRRPHRQGIWTFDPGIDKEKGYKGCCDVVNRGVALWKGKVFVGAYDGRLIALDAVTGKEVWEKDTIVSKEHSYTITGAPRVFNGKVVIGNGGAEYGARGYVTAYDAETGNQAWRWFTVPGDPSKPFEDESMAAAAKTWDPAGKYWVNGGGGTAWDTITFDPDLNMVYVGTGNGSPWNRDIRSPAGGDNLYLASLVALNADTGKYIWHYQETPGDHWDYTATQPMILADLNIDGAPRKVILHAPKNGFFFVVDRTNGKFISAKNFVDVNWATGYGADGRPIEVKEARGDEAYDSIPGPYGAHNWHPMSFNPQTGLVYLPAQGVPLNLTPEKTVQAQRPASPASSPRGMAGTSASCSTPTPPKNTPFGRLLAWDPVKQKEAWRAEYVAPWNGGTLTTAGNLVFQGTADGRFVAYNATTGEKLWEIADRHRRRRGGLDLHARRQAICVDRGRLGRRVRDRRTRDRISQPGHGLHLCGRRQGAAAGFREVPDRRPAAGVKYDPKDVPEGTALYVTACAACHGVPGVHKGGNVRNLGYVAEGDHREPQGHRVQGPVQRPGHARLHRQADRSGRDEDHRPSSRAPRTRSGRSRPKPRAAEAIARLVMAGHSRPKDGVATACLCPAIHVFVPYAAKTGCPGRRRAEATPSFRRRCPGMTESGSIQTKRAARDDRAALVSFRGEPSEASPQNIRPSFTSTQRPFLTCWTWVRWWRDGWSSRTRSAAN